MATLMVLYSKPTDAAAFNSYYFGKHVPLAKPRRRIATGGPWRYAGRTTRISERQW
jgi:hypothetical protein